MNQRATETNLNHEEFEQLKTMYVDTIVDSMSSKDLYAYVYDDMTDFMNKLTYNEAINEVKYTLDEEMLEEFIKQIRGKIQYNAIQITFLNIIKNVYVSSISFIMCLGLVVFAGVQSLRSNYNIRHAKVYEIFTFSDNKFMTV